MKKRLVLLSTGIGLVNSIMEVVRGLDPEIEIFNIVDDSIIASIRENDNRIPPETFRRMTGYCCMAQDLQADALLLTCSSISEAIDAAQPMTSLPLFKIDEPMAEQAVALSDRAIGVVATLATTLHPTCRLIESKIAVSGKNLQVQPHLCEGAFEAYLQGDSHTHNRIVLEGVHTLLQHCDYVVLAQASMAGAVQSMKSEARARVLTSPELGIRRVVDYLRQAN